MNYKSRFPDNYDKRWGTALRDSEDEKKDENEKLDNPKVDSDNNLKEEKSRKG